MAADVKRVGGTLLLALAWAGAANGAGLEADPTLPPTVTEGSLAQAGGKSASPVLESVLIPVKGRPMAVISGKSVVLGEKFGEDRLVKVTENEVVLRGKEGDTRLALNPAVSLKPISRHQAGAQSGAQAPARSQP